ncbi:hypothetical protein D3C71_2249990 [compost metagenome]
MGFARAAVAAARRILQLLLSRQQGVERGGIEAGQVRRAQLDQRAADQQRLGQQQR